MSQFEYRVVPFVGQISTGAFSTDSAATVSEQLQAVIDSHAVEGWVFDSLAKVDVEVKPGCLGTFMGHGSSFLTFDQVVFRRSLS